MTTQWRETSSGERQWLGADGNWYSSEQMALTAGTTRQDPNRPPAPNLPPPPGIYQQPTVRAQARRASPNNRGLKAAIGLTVVAILVVVLLIQATTESASTNTGTPAGGSNNSQAVTQSTTPVQGWLGTNGATFKTLGSDEGTIQQDALAGAQSGDFTILASDCQALGSDAQTAQSLPPIPDATAQGQWSSILANLVSAAQDCTNGVAQQDTGLIAQSATEMKSADSKATALANSLGLG